MLGFLAQDVESVVPEAVVGGPAQGQAYGMNYTEFRGKRGNRVKVGSRINR